MPIKQKLIDKLNEPETRASLLRYLWIISLLMLVLGYVIIAYIWFNT